jgi:RNA-binding protein PNO1
LVQCGSQDSVEFDPFQKFTPIIGTTCSASINKRRNRRKLNKNQAQHRKHLKLHHVLDEELADITDALSQPVEISSLFASPNPSTKDNAYDGDEVMINVSISTLSAPIVAPSSLQPHRQESNALLAPETLRIPMPPHRMTPLKKD